MTMLSIRQEQPKNKINLKIKITLVLYNSFIFIFKLNFIKTIADSHGVLRVILSILYAVPLMVTFHKTEVQYHNQYIYINTTHWFFEITPVSLNLCLCVYMCVFSSIEFHHSQHLYIYIYLSDNSFLYIITLSIYTRDTSPQHTMLWYSPTFN